MRKLFPGYYSPDEDETNKQWEDGIFVFDTSVLLNLYSYPEQAREEFLIILEGLADRTWIPYQVMLEFHRNRYKRISSSNRSVLDLKANIKKLLQVTKEGFSSIQFEKRNKGIEDIEKRIFDFEKYGENLLDALEEACRRLNRVGLADDIALRLSNMYEDKIGSPPKNQDELEKFLLDADERFEKKIPPGFADAKEKTAVEYHDGLKYETKYGDLVVWRQIIEHVRTVPEARVILITAERKNDFWLKDEKDKIIGPLPDLISEFLKETKAVSFWIYSAEDFLEGAKRRGNNVVSADTIKEVRDISLKYDVVDTDLEFNGLDFSSSLDVDAYKAVENSKKIDLIALRFIGGRYPEAKVVRLSSGWIVRGNDEEVFFQILMLDHVDLSVISKYARNMIEPLVYSKCILLILMPVDGWRRLNPVAVNNLEKLLRKIMIKECLAEIVMILHDSSLKAVGWHEIRATDDAL